MPQPDAVSAAGKDDGLECWLEGKQALAAGDAALARELLAEACALLPAHGAAHHLLGKVEALLGRPAEAEALQRRSQALDEAIGWNSFALAELLEQRGAWAEAGEAYNQALEQLPQESWIGAKANACRQRGLLGGEDLREGLGPMAYRFWVDQLEPPLPSDLEPLHRRWQVLMAGESGSGPLPAQGWLVLLGAGCVLRPRALQGLECWLQNAVQPPAPDLLSVDEDRLDAAGQRYDPWFKPEQLAESSWSTPWLSSCSAWRCSWLREQELGWPPVDAEQRQAWLWLALARRPQHRHVPQVLVHRRATAAEPLSRAVQARLLQEHLQAQGEAVTAVHPHPQRPEGFVITWAVPAPLRCSLIVPTRDRADLLETCITSLTASTAGSALAVEWIVVDNGSREPALAALLQRWQERLGERLRVLRDEGPFNWSVLNNRAAQTSQAELLLFLNNDVEASSSGWLEAMAAQAMRPAVGCVGAVLLYPSGRLQHAGVVVGLHGGADHAYRHLPPGHGVHRGRSSHLSDWGAVTGACLMVRRALFERAGGFDPALPVEFNDVDFCLRLGHLGYRHVVDPRAELIHHESQSRDAIGSSTAQAALERMRGRWGPRLASTTPWWPATCSAAHADGRPLELDRVVPVG